MEQCLWYEVRWDSMEPAIWQWRHDDIHGNLAVILTVSTILSGSPMIGSRRRASIANVIAVTRVRYNAMNGEMTDVDIAMNARSE